jgi:hypothetical protein
MIWAAISWYSILLVPLLPFRAKLLQGSMWAGWVIMIQMLFPNNDVTFHDDNAPIHTAGTVQSWFEENEGELQLLPWPAQSPDLNITESLWSVLDTRVRNRIPPSFNISKAT